MTDTAYTKLLDALRGHGSTIKEAGTRAQAQCPGHADSAPSLSVTDTETRVLIHCHAGCDRHTVLDTLGLGDRDLYDRDRVDYRYPGGRIKHRNTRTKRFHQSGDTKNANLYRADQLGDAKTVYLVEGEEDVHAIESLGGTAVSAPSTSGQDKYDYTPLRGRNVVVVRDKDATGRKHAERVAGILDGIAASVGIAEAKVGKDASDHVAAGHSLDDLVVHSTPPTRTATPQQSWSGAVPGVARLRYILAGVGDEVRDRGLVGEERIAKILYLVFTSRLLDKQVSAGVKGHSASGKSYTVELVTKFFPPEAFLEFTAMSERALIYSPEQFAHRCIVVYELTALREGVEDDLTSYFIRTLLSEGRLVYDVTIKDRDGQFTTRKIIKEGPTNLVFTTTKTKVHAENETRILSLNTDDSTAQTARVLRELADENGCGTNLDEWVDLQRWLASDAAEHRVTIPYARVLAELVPPIAVRLRRDFASVLALVRAHAMLHQATRERDEHGRIVATVEDYEVVRGLVADIVTEGLGATVSPTVRDTVAVVAKRAEGEGVMVRVVAADLGIDKSNAGRRLRLAADGGYVRNLEDKRGRPARWVIGDPLPDEVVVLPTATQLATPGALVDLECCGVAAVSEEGSAKGNGHRSGYLVDPPEAIVPGGPGRCDECGFHTETQGHRDGCGANETNERNSR